MNSKMQNKESLEQQVQIASSDHDLLKDEESEAIAGGRLDDLLKNLALRSKVARWAAVVASVVVGISVGMVMPAHAVNRAGCEAETFNIAQGGRKVTMCFANGGDIFVGIADVHQIYSGNNAGSVITNVGIFDFEKHEIVDFFNTGGPVTILQILIK